MSFGLTDLPGWGDARLDDSDKIQREDSVRASARGRRPGPAVHGAGLSLIQKPSSSRTVAIVRTQSSPNPRPPTTPHCTSPSADSSGRRKIGCFFWSVFQDQFPAAATRAMHRVEHLGAHICRNGRTPATPTTAAEAAAASVDTPPPL